MVRFKTKLVPLWLSVWGLTGIFLMLVSSAIGIIGLLDASSLVSSLLCMPILVQELVLAIWLIIKGFSSPITEKNLIAKTNNSEQETVPR